jgi:hypothetical protein
MNKPDGGPAYPIPKHSDTCTCPCGNEGMSIRDYFAAAAAQGYYAVPGQIKPEEDARLIYQIADAMVKERDK